MSKFLAKKYALTASEAAALAALKGGVDAVEAWREANGLPHPSSALTRGKVQELIGFERSPPRGITYQTYTGGEEVPGPPSAWVRAGLIGATHPATKRGAKYRCVRFGALIVCEPNRAFNT